MSKVHCRVPVGSTSFLYIDLANDVDRQIQEGVFRPGERLPSIRRLKHERGLSVSTISRAFVELESRGLVEPRPRSGYFVVRKHQNLGVPTVKRSSLRPRQVPLPLLADEFVTASANTKLVPLGGAVLAPELLPLKRLARATRDALQQQERVFSRYGSPAGAAELRRAIAKRMLQLGHAITMNDVIITSGCMDAIRLALLAVAGRGDIIAVASPTFFGFLQLIRELGLVALQVPVDPQTGIDLPSLERMVSKYDVRALVLTPSYQNPTGALMPQDARETLARIAERHNFTIVEDDVYGDLNHHGVRPKPISSSDEGADVVYCSSVSKTLSPGERIGWIVGGRHQEKLLRLKLSGTIASPQLSQLAVASILEGGGFDRHLRKLRAALARQMGAVCVALANDSPKGTKITQPSGGFLIWVQFPKGVDALALYDGLYKRGVSILPGALCAINPKTYETAVRISCGYPFTEAIRSGLRTICVEANKQLTTVSVSSSSQK